MKKIIYTQGNTDYEVKNLLGAWLESEEDRHLKIGDVRFIGNKLFAVYGAKYGFLTSKYSWVPADDIKYAYAEIKEWTNKLESFGHIY